MAWRNYKIKHSGKIKFPECFFYINKSIINLIADAVPKSNSTVPVMNERHERSFDTINIPLKNYSSFI